MSNTLRTLIFLTITNLSAVYGQSLKDMGLFLTLPFDIDVELQSWSRKWTFDSYVNGSVQLTDLRPALWKEKSSWNELGLDKITGLSTQDKENHGAFATGYFYVKRFGSRVKTDFKAYAYFAGNKKIIRICYRDNLESRCND